MRAKLFAAGDLSSWLSRRLGEAVQKVAEIEPERVRFSPEEVTEAVVAEYQIEPVSLNWDGLSRDEPRETQFKWNEFGDTVSIPGHKIAIYVPVSGDMRLLQMKASTFELRGPPEATLANMQLVFDISAQNLTVEAFKHEVDVLRKRMDDFVSWSNGDVAQWTPSLRAEVGRAVDRRKAQLDHGASLSAALDIPLRSADPAHQVHLPVRRKKVRLTRPAAISAQGGTSSDLRMADAIYEDVIETLSALGRSFERLPGTASRFNEEELRDVLLFVLNSNYEGLARGEVFNGQGKTDLLIPYRDHNAFIGECKIWRGRRKFTDAIDQLLGYTVWRDTKAALVLFIRNKSATDLIDKADETIRAHDCFLSLKPPSHPEFRRDYLLHSKDDSERHIRLAFLPVVVPPTS